MRVQTNYRGTTWIKINFMGKGLSTLDKRILNRLQEDIPFASRPWEIIACEIGIAKELLFKRIALLKKRGIIRRIAATFNPAKVGFVSTLVAAKIAPKNIKAAVGKINNYAEVTHNYHRDAEYNIWFTLVGRSKKRLAEILTELGKDRRIEKLLDLPAKRLFKIDVNFRMRNNAEDNAEQRGK